MQHPFMVWQTDNAEWSMRSDARSKCPATLADNVGGCPDNSRDSVRQKEDG
jgi:hypothetical protein